MKAREPVLNRQKHQLAVISEFCTEIAHVPGVDNVVADVMSRQHDDKVGGDRAFVHAVAHFLADVDFDELAADQPSDPDVQDSPSFSLRWLRMPGCSREIWCDTSQSGPRFLVPQGWRQRIFDSVHKLSHPSGRATLAIIYRTYVWKGMHRDVLAWSRACEECARGKVA